MKTRKSATTAKTETAKAAAASRRRPAPKKKPETATPAKDKTASRIDAHRALHDVEGLRKTLAALRLASVDLFAAFGCIPVANLDALNRPESDRDWRLFALSYDIMNFRDQVKVVIQDVYDTIAAAQSVAQTAAAAPSTDKPAAPQKGRETAR